MSLMGIALNFPGRQCIYFVYLKFSLYIRHIYDKKEKKTTFQLLINQSRLFKPRQIWEQPGSFLLAILYTR